MEKHRCAECGFLATRNRETSNLDAMEQNYRNTGKSSQKVGFSPPYDIHEAPVCLMQVCDLWSEIGKSDAKNILSVIRKDRPCEAFRKWQQGFTPKEHREMMDRERFEERLREDKKSDRRWRIIELFCLLVGSGLFTLLGAWIAKR